MAIMVCLLLWESPHLRCLVLHKHPTRQRSTSDKQSMGVCKGALLLTEITQPCVHTCDGLFICQLHLLPDLLEEMDCKEDTPLTLPFASFISLSQLMIVIWIKTSVGITTVFYTGISRAVAAA
jgi:hypothetical protein